MSLIELTLEGTKNKTNLIWSVSFLMVPVLMISIGFHIMRAFDPSLNDLEKLEQQATERVEKSRENAKENISIYKDGTYAEQYVERFETTLKRQIGAVFYGCGKIGISDKEHQNKGDDRNQNHTGQNDFSHCRVMIFLHHILLFSVISIELSEALQSQ